MDTVFNLETLSGISKIPGNVIPNAWFSAIIREDKRGKHSDHSGCLLLGDILFYYRSKKFKHSQKVFVQSVKDFANKFSVSPKVIRRSLHLLEDLGLINLIYRPIQTPLGIVPKALHITLNIQLLLSITFPEENDFLPKTLNVKTETIDTTECSQLGTSSELDGNEVMPNPESTHAELAAFSIYREDLESCREVKVQEEIKEEGSPEHPLVPQENIQFSLDAFFSCDEDLKKAAASSFIQKNRTIVDADGGQMNPSKDGDRYWIRSFFLGDKDFDGLDDYTDMVFNRRTTTKGSLRSVSTDPWMKGTNVRKDLLDWLFKQRENEKTGNYQVNLPNIASEFRGDYVRGRDLYKQFLLEIIAKEEKAEQSTQLTSIEPTEEEKQDYLQNILPIKNSSWHIAVGYEFKRVGVSGMLEQGYWWIRDWIVLMEQKPEVLPFSIERGYAA